jgi:hypothetical protein
LLRHRQAFLHTSTFSEFRKRGSSPGNEISPNSRARSPDQAALFSAQAHVSLMPFASCLAPHIRKTYNSDIRFSYWTTGSAVFSIHFRKDLWLAGHRHFLSFRRFGNSRNVEVPSRSRSTSTITALLRSTITFSLTPPTNHEHDHVSSSQLTPRASSLTPSLSVASLPFLTVACCLSPVAYSFTFKEGSSRRGYCGS